MTTKTVLIIAAVSFADEKGVMCYAGEKVEVTQELLDKQNELCEKFDLPKHTVVEQVETATETTNGDQKQTEEPKGKAGGKAAKTDDL